MHFGVWGGEGEANGKVWTEILDKGVTAEANKLPPKLSFSDQYFNYKFVLRK